MAQYMPLEDADADGAAGGSGISGLPGLGGRLKTFGGGGGGV